MSSFDRAALRPDPRRIAETASSLGLSSPGTNDRGTQQSGNEEPAPWPAEAIDIGTEKEIKEFARQIQEEGLLNGHDLDKIDLNQNAELSSTITEAYRRRQSGRAQKESEKVPLLNESPEPEKIIDQSTRSGKVVSDLVRDSKLETIIASNGSVVRHISYISNPRMRQRRMKKEETWRRRKKLGSGSFGCVWLEERLDGDGTGRLRAVKEITKSREGKGSRIDYNRELEAIAKFSHSKYVHCFVQSFGWYESENTIFITMEYIEKGDLQSYLVRPFPEEEVKQIAFQLLEGLEYMHENGFAHRDLKPANILVSEPSPNWWVKISDFGISKRAEEEATAYRTFVGTRGYLAPEILGIYSIADMNNISSSQTLDDSSSLYTVSVDLWALGAIIYRLLTNEVLFGDPRDLAKYVAAGHPFPRATASELGASEACVDFLENIMARSPNSRPSSSEALHHPWLSELQDLVDTATDALEELSIAVEDSRTEHTIVDTSVASAQWPTSLG
uniref:Autophagy-related protein 1 n=1 Tax=Bionectria ochroleuca TaxID=29856 RepID=A0A0B7JHE2_BIOOC